MCLTRAEAIAAADSALKGMEAVGTTDAFKSAAINKAIEAAAMRKAYATCDSSRTATERSRLAMQAGWEQEKNNTTFYQEQSKRRGKLNWYFGIAAGVATLLHFVK